MKIGAMSQAEFTAYVQSALREAGIETADGIERDASMTCPWIVETG